MGEVDAVVNQHFQVDIGELVILVVGRDLFDVDPHAVDTGGDHGNHAAAIFDLDAQFNRIFALDQFVPAQSDQALAFLAHIRQVLAALPVDHHPLFGTEVTLDRVPRDGVAAAGIIHHEALGTADGDRRHIVRRPGRVGAQPTQQLLRGDGRQAVAAGDLFQQVVQ